MRLVPLLPQRADAALTTRELARRFYGLSSPEEAGSHQIRKIQRSLEELSVAAEEGQAPVAKVEGSNPPAYYLRNEHLVQWYMTEQVALNLLLARQTLKAAVGDEVLGAGSLEQAAGQLVRESRETQRLWSRIRMARSGIGRQPPAIAPQVMKVLLEAVRTDRQVRRQYTNARGVFSTRDVTIHGLVLKDDSVYVLVSEGLSDPLQHLPAHRIVHAELLHKPAQHRPGFDLDDYIEQDFQLSHVINREKPSGPIELQLRVRNSHLYHFRERPLTRAQVVAEDPERPGWHRVSAHLPDTFMLKHFLQSMGSGVEVLAPAALRQEIAREARETASWYAA